MDELKYLDCDYYSVEEIGGKRWMNKEISQAANPWVNQREQILGIIK